MRIAFLCKRRYMRKDVILDRYARMYELPRQLADRGHEVLGVCLDYHSKGAVDIVEPESEGRLRWRSFDAGPLFIAGALTHPQRLRRILSDFRPDVIMAASDAPHIVLGRWLAQRFRLPFVVDLYDNLESFALTRKLGLVNVYRRSVARADLVSCVSEPLADRVRRDYRARGHVMALPSTIDTRQFYPREKWASRRALGLPLHSKLIGTAGALKKVRGIETLYRAFASLSQQREDVDLVLAGPAEAAAPMPTGPRVHYLGQLPHEDIPRVFSALDVGIICLRDTDFGRFSFPQKAYEMLACNLPVVAGRVGSMADLLGDTRASLYDPDDPQTLLTCLDQQLDTPNLCSQTIPTWTEAGAALDDALREIAVATN